MKTLKKTNVLRLRLTGKKHKFRIIANPHEKLHFEHNNLKESFCLWVENYSFKKKWSFILFSSFRDQVLLPRKFRKSYVVPHFRIFSDYYFKKVYKPNNSKKTFSDEVVFSYLRSGLFAFFSSPNRWADVTTVLYIAASDLQL